MKKINFLFITIAIIILGILILGFVENVKIKNDKKFNVDINKLSYILPKHDMICLPDKRYFCYKDNCSKEKPMVFLLVNKQDKIIYRCDNKPCDKYEYELSQSGVYENIRPINNNGLLYKISNIGGYTEVSTLLDGAYLTFGQCK